MTREETEKALIEARDQYKETANGSFRRFCVIYDILLYKTCLLYGVDPESVWFYYDVEQGKGTKWPDRNS